MVTTSSVEAFKISMPFNYTVTLMKLAKVIVTTRTRKLGGAQKTQSSEDKLIHHTTGMLKQM